MSLQDQVFEQLDNAKDSGFNMKEAPVDEVVMDLLQYGVFGRALPSQLRPIIEAWQKRRNNDRESS